MQTTKTKEKIKVRKICLLTGLDKMVELMTDTLKIQVRIQHLILTQRKTSQWSTGEL